ncbi:hypothetical protein JHK86_043188 [Glycine max]|nr:hypothetical protein JHK86_043188 [Glycine max]
MQRKRKKKVKRKSGVEALQSCDHGSLPLSFLLASADDIPSSSTSTPLLATIGPDLEVVPPSPPLIIISDSPSGEAAALPESPTREALRIGKKTQMLYDVEQLQVHG